MSGTGQKRQLKQLMKNVKQMLRFLGQQQGSNLVIYMDQFEYLRQDFQNSAKEYEKSTNQLQDTTDKGQRGILIYKISSSRTTMDKSLKNMSTILLKMQQKMNRKNKKKKVIRDANGNVQPDKLQCEFQYKTLTLYQLQKIYFQLTKKEPSSVKKKQYYPDAITIEQIKLRKPLHRGFSQQTDKQSEEYIKQQQMLQLIKQIDGRIEQKMDYILDGIHIMHENSLAISQGIDQVHKRIIINVQHLQKNMIQMEQAQDLLEQASKSTSKPNCIMNVIIVILLAILLYLIVRKLIEEDTTTGITTRQHLSQQ